jgi:uridine phosphorylase
MPFPNFPNKLDGTPVMTARAVIDNRRRARQFPSMDAPSGMIICLDRSLPQSASRQHPTRKVGASYGDILLLNKTKGRVGVVAQIGFGAPVVAGVIEEMVAWGVERFVLVSLCGGLQPDLNAGQVVLVDRAIRDEGTSHHYLPSEKYALPDAGLCAALGDTLKPTPHLTGTTWTTDAPYRETREEVTALQSEGVLTVDMETAAFFAVARSLQIPAASMLVVGDSLAGDSWQPVADFKPVQKSLLVAYSAAIDLLNR